MMNLRSLIDWLHPYFKENDTYIRNGKGILERFLEIGGNYFADEVVPEIDNILDIIDIDTTDEQYLNFIWEWLGSIPYSYGTVHKKGIWDLYYNTELNKDTWISSATQLPRADYRNLLKYAISLYKIRGTLRFYPILLSFYDFECTVSDDSGDFNNVQGTINMEPKMTVALYDDDWLYDEEELFYDEVLDCYTCGEIRLTIGRPAGNDFTTAARDRLFLLLNRFRPVNVLPFDISNTTFYIKS